MGIGALLGGPEMGFRGDARVAEGLGSGPTGYPRVGDCAERVFCRRGDRCWMGGPCEVLVATVPWDDLDNPDELESWEADLCGGAGSGRTVVLPSSCGGEGD